MEEWRLGRDSRGRTGEAQWKLIMKGCKVRLSDSVNGFVLTCACMIQAAFITVISHLSLAQLQSIRLHDFNMVPHTGPHASVRLC